MELHRKLPPPPVSLESEQYVDKEEKEEQRKVKSEKTNKKNKKTRKTRRHQPESHLGSLPIHLPPLSIKLNSLVVESMTPTANGMDKSLKSLGRMVRRCLMTPLMEKSPPLGLKTGERSLIGRCLLSSVEISSALKPLARRDPTRLPELVPTTLCTLTMLLSSIAAITPACRAKARNPEERTKSTGIGYAI